LNPPHPTGAAPRYRHGENRQLSTLNAQKPLITGLELNPGGRWRGAADASTAVRMSL